MLIVYYYNNFLKSVDLGGISYSTYTHIHIEREREGGSKGNFIKPGKN